jgi:hypothetical protein
MEYVIELGSGVMIYMPSFIKIGSRIQTLMGRGSFTEGHSMEIA